MAEKITYGLKNVHYAPLSFDEQGLPVYGTPVKYPGAVELTLTPRGEIYSFYADDLAYFTSAVNNGYDGTFTSADIPASFKQVALGETLNADNVLVETTNDKSSAFAMMFEFETDLKARRHVLYNCTASRPTVGSATKGESMEVRTNELTFVASGLDDGTDKPKVKAVSTQETSKAVYDSWMDAVYLASLEPELEE